MTESVKPLSPALTLHSLRHTFATRRLEMGDSMARMQRLMGHRDANTLMRYAHIEPAPLADLFPLLASTPGIPPNSPLLSSSPSPPDGSNTAENLDARPTENVGGEKGRDASKAVVVAAHDLTEC